METYTRQQLHDLVWSGPMRDVAKTLGLSDNGLRKHCVKAFVNLPPQGHWNRVKAGQAVKTNPLPARPPGLSNTVTIGQWDYRFEEKRLLEVEPTPPVFDEPIEAVRERVSRNLGRVVEPLRPPTRFSQTKPRAKTAGFLRLSQPTVRRAYLWWRRECQSIRVER